MMKIVALIGSNSSNSINRKLLRYSISKLKNVEEIELGNLDVPIYNPDIEKSQGIPDDILSLAKRLHEADTIVLASPEHNGLMPAFLKNILDWLSRVGYKYMENSVSIILTTSPGKGGGVKSAKVLEKVLPYGGTKVLGSFSLPSFHENFQNHKIINAEFDEQLNKLLNELA